MISFSEPPPLQVRVESLKEAVQPTPKFGAPIGAWLTGLLIIALTGIVGIWRENHSKGTKMLEAAMTNTLPRQTEAGVLRVLPLGTDMRAVLTQLEELRATCRTVGASDSLVVCLGFPIVRANTYTRQRIRFTARDGKLSAVEACPTFVHWSTTPVPDALAARVAHPAAHDCWRDEANQADNDWAFATLPDRAFTLVVVHGADSVRRLDSPTADTLVVRW